MPEILRVAFGSPQHDVRAIRFSVLITMPFDLIIRNAKVVAPDGVKDLEIAVANERIAELSPTIRGAAREEIDATGLHVFPGLIDPHVHFNEPGRTDWEGFATGSAALAAGGGTCFFDMPLNSSPPTLDGPSFDAKLRAAQTNSRTDFVLWGGLVPGNVKHLEELGVRGVVGFKAFMCDSGIDDFKRAGDGTLQQGMATAAHLGLPVAVHAEDQATVDPATQECMSSGRTDVRNYLRSRSVEAEVTAIQRAIAIARDTESALHIVHVSSGAGIDRAVQARARWRVDVTCETCPHYLELTEQDVERIGAPAKCSPPIRSEVHRQELWHRLRGGRIDLVSSDHSPAPTSMKQSGDFFRVWGGIAGVQSTLSILLTHRPALSLEQIARLVSTNVADRFRIPQKGRIAVGYDADLALVDTDAAYTLTRDMLLDRHKLSPYVGRTFRGLVRRTIVRGHTVFHDGKIVGNFRGRLITPNRKGKPHA
jgi:allantoinase